MSKLFILLILFCISCSNVGWVSIDLNSTYALDSSFTQDEQAEIVKALWNWEQATHGIVNMKLIVTDTPNLYSGFPKIIKSNEWIPSKLGTTNHDVNDAIIFIYIKVIEDNIANKTHASIMAVAEHEMGHSFGLVHASHGLMTDTAPKECIDWFTLEQFCEIHNCSMDEMKTNCQE